MNVGLGGFSFFTKGRYISCNNVRFSLGPVSVCRCDSVVRRVDGFVANLGITCGCGPCRRVRFRMLGDQGKPSRRVCKSLRHAGLPLICALG